MSELSVITIVRNRQLHLSRLLDGLASSSEAPRELIVVDMNAEPVVLPRLGFFSRRIEFNTKKLALAAARNAGAKAATGERLLFLDVDCIPRRNLVATMDRQLTASDALICAEVRYLGPGGSRCRDDDALERDSVRHPARVFPVKGHRIEPNPGLFWSLTFGIRHSRFDALGGFDEGYVGYGAEDTDLGFRAREAGVPLMFLGGTGSFHQYHGVMSPPLQYLDDIVRNANRFRARWGLWPMDDWLKDFSKLGLVSFDNAEVRRLRAPTAAELEIATQPPTVVY